MINMEVINTADPGGEGGSTIDIERINSQLSLSCEQVIASVDGGGKDTPRDIPCVVRVGH